MPNRKLRQMPVWFDPDPDSVAGPVIKGRFHVRGKVYVIYANQNALQIVFVRGWRGRLHPLIEGKTKQALRQFWRMLHNMGESR